MTTTGLVIDGRSYDIGHLNGRKSRDDEITAKNREVAKAKEEADSAKKETSQIRTEKQNLES